VTSARLKKTGARLAPLPVADSYPASECIQDIARREATHAALAQAAICHA
jgi:hypothetical protein